MKKVLLSGVALAGLVLAATPAKAEVDLNLGGFFMGYAVWADSNETGTTATGDDLRQFDFRRRTEVHFTGETTLDNGLTVGAHAEMLLGDEVGTNETDEVYAYFSGQWGRVNFGSEDGAAYLLQVAAPSADANVDGLRTYIQAIDLSVGATGAIGGLTEPSGLTGNTLRLDYDNAPFEDAERITYLTPQFEGFQAGLSYAPQTQAGGTSAQQAIRGGFTPPSTDDDASQYDQVWDAAARYDGEFSGVGVSAGVGYTHASLEATTAGLEDLDTWDAGLTLTWGAFSLGGAYLDSDNGISTNGDTTTWVAGLGWENGPWTAGASWLNSQYEAGTALATVGELEVNRYTVGGGYEFGPGMSFRGAVAFGKAEDNGAGGTDENFTQVTLGTDISF